MPPERWAKVTAADDQFANMQTWEPYPGGRLLKCLAPVRATAVIKMRKSDQHYSARRPFPQEKSSVETRFIFILASLDRRWPTGGQARLRASGFGGRLRPAWHDATAELN